MFLPNDEETHIVIKNLVIKRECVFLSKLCLFCKQKYFVMNFHLSCPNKQIISKALPKFYEDATLEIL